METDNQEPRTYNQEPNINTPPTPSRGGEEEFEKFYDAYPKHASKARALVEWKDLTGHGLATPEQLIGSAKAFAKAMRTAGRDINFIPTPANYLNGDTWQDYATTTKTRYEWGGITRTWLQANLLSKLPPGVSPDNPEHDFWVLVKTGTPKDQAAQQIIEEA
jgi:hypothetical protein